ncbi:Hypothetical predicted protein [Lynx pardinus]|uniref:Uncharacterized protein n=1 Tax=Lynx pardinus TaxID=191816 RepID=A0A485MVW4_LYNPA|nr:Hypothetical predicted protein [Lynx pardinus]
MCGRTVDSRASPATSASPLAAASTPASWGSPGVSTPSRSKRRRNASWKSRPVGTAGTRASAPRSAPPASAAFPTTSSKCPGASSRCPWTVMSVQVGAGTGAVAGGCRAPSRLWPHGHRRQAPGPRGGQVSTKRL